MRRLTEEMTRLVGEIHAARDDRRRLMRDLKHATAEMKRAVAHLRSSFAAELAGARAAWLGVPALVTRGVELAASWQREPEAEHEPEPEAEHEPKVEHQDVLQKAVVEHRPLEAERRAPDKTRIGRKKARGRHRPR